MRNFFFYKRREILFKFLRKYLKTNSKSSIARSLVNRYPMFFKVGSFEKSVESVRLLIRNYTGNKGNFSLSVLSDDSIEFLSDEKLKKREILRRRYNEKKKIS